MKVSSLTEKQLEQLIDLLLKCEAVNEPTAWSLVIRCLPGEISSNIPYSALLYARVGWALYTCSRFPGGVTRLLNALRRMEGDTFAMRNINEFIKRSPPAEDLLDFIGESSSGSLPDEWRISAGTELNDRFIVGKKIASNNYSNTYEGWQKSTGNKVSIRVLAPLLSEEENIRSRFRRESSLILLLHHPNIAKIIDYDASVAGFLYFVMEELKGNVLYEIMNIESSLHWRRVTGIIYQLCCALTEIHKSDIVHRDIGPWNIFLNQKPDCDEVKLIGFTMAKILQDSTFSRVIPRPIATTASSHILGSEFYAAPEQLLHHEASRQTDIYSLGTLAYALLTGNIPFYDSENIVDITRHRMTEMPPPPLAF